MKTLAQILRPITAPQYAEKREHIYQQYKKMLAAGMDNEKALQYAQFSVNNLKPVYPHISITYFACLQRTPDPYSVFLKTKMGQKLIVSGCKTIEQAHGLAQQWADELKIPICLHETT